MKLGMSYYTSILQDVPDLLLMLDGNSQDSSGYNVPVTVVGSPVYEGQALVDGAIKTPLITSDNYFKFPWPYLLPDTERQPVTIEAWVDLGSTTNSYVGARMSDNGISWYNGEFRFRLNLTSGVVSARYRPSRSGSFHVVGVYTGTTILLYVDGELVDSVQLTSAQLNDKIVATSDDGFLWIFGGGIQVQAFAMYDRALDSNVITKHYNSGLRATNPSDVAAMYSGVEEKLSADNADRYLYLDGDDYYFFSVGQGTCQIADTLTNPESSLTPYDAGTWDATFELSSGITSIQSVVLEYESEGNVLVQTSLNGSDWSTHTSGERVAGIDPGFDPTGKMLYVKVTFTQYYYGSIKRIRISGFKSKSLFSNQRVITIPDSTTFYYPRKINEFYKTGIRFNGNVDFGPSGQTTSAVGFWYYSATGNVTFPGNSSFFENGVAGSQRAVAGRWTYVVLNLSNTSGTSTVTISGDMTLAYVSFYQNVITADQAMNIYMNYLGVPALLVTDPITFGVQTVSALLYNNNWTAY